jgi:hypothetical protein
VDNRLQFVDAVDVSRRHVDGEFVRPVFVLAEHAGDIADREDGCDRREDQAA